MVRQRFLSMVLVILAGSVGKAADENADTDADGIRDRHEEVLGTDLSQPEVLCPVVEDGPEADSRRALETYDASKDVTQLECCHVGDDRYLWRVTLADKPRLEDTVLHLYVDADADPATGRKGPDGAASTGTEYMLSVVGARGTAAFYDAEGNRTNGPLVSHAVDGNQVLISADVDLGRDEQGIRYALYVLCHTVTTKSGESPGMSDASGKRVISGIPVYGRKKVMRPRDYRDNFNVQATFGLDLLREILLQDDAIVIPHDQLEADGFAVDHFTSRRWPHVRREADDGRVWTTAPKPGSYHVGFMMDDDGNDERVAFYVDNQFRGIAVSNQDNNRTWLYWLDSPVEFRGGERVELRAVGASGKHGISNLLFLNRPPEVRKIRYAVENLTSFADFNNPGRVTVSWTTTWPCPTRFEYGKDTTYGAKVETEGNCLVHRVVLEGLDPNAEYHGRAIGATRDGSPYHGDDFAFRASPSSGPETRPDVGVVPIFVRNPHSFSVDNWPVTTGIPFPRGQLGSLEHVRLMSDGCEIPAQVRLTARWPDGSVKWLLVTFQAAVTADARGEYQLEFGRDVRRAKPQRPLTVTENDRGVAIDTGVVRFRLDSHGNLSDFTTAERQLLPTGAFCDTRAVDTNGVSFGTAGGIAEVSIEEAGPLRVVVKVVSQLTGPDGEHLMRVEKRIEAYQGTAHIRIHHALVVDQPDKFTEFGKLSYRIPLAGKDCTWRVATTGGETMQLDASRPIAHQRFDDEFVIESGDGESVSKGRIIGSILAEGPDGCAVAVRDFWQNYPKAFSLDNGALHIELCPDFDEGLYDQFPFEKQGHQLYYYLLGGRYRLKRGMSKTHEMLLCFEPDDRRSQVCELFQRPLLATAEPKWYCDSKAFYDVAPRDTERFRLYEEAIDRNLAAYADRRERQHDFGMLNYGDWYGERGTNWGNIEYDTQHAFFLEYIRSGNPDAFVLGEATELHNRDIDTVHWSEDPRDIGAVYVHQMCHVGDYYDKPVPGSLGYPRGGYTVSHAWTEGHFEHYFLTGDRRSYETGCAVADFFIRKQLGRPYDFSSCRTPGWHLIMLAAAYAATNDPYYLNAARVVVDRVLETQDTKPRPLPAYQAEGRKPFQVGGWSRMMVPGHCQCEPRHRGNAGFMVAVLLAGLKYYHDVTGDERVKQSIIQGAHYLLDETYSDEVHGFRYTSCPETTFGAGASPLMVEGVARAHLWTRDERFRRVLTEALPRSAGGSSYGKGFSMYYRMGPRVLADLDASGITLDKAPDR